MDGRVINLSGIDKVRLLLGVYQNFGIESLRDILSHLEPLVVFLALVDGCRRHEEVNWVHDLHEMSDSAIISGSVMGDDVITEFDLVLEGGRGGLGALFLIHY